MTRRKNKLIQLRVKLNEIAWFEPPLDVKNGAMCVNQPFNGIGREEATPYLLSHRGDFNVERI